MLPMTEGGHPRSRWLQSFPAPPGDVTQSQKASSGLYVIVCKMGTTVGSTAPTLGLLTVRQVQTERTPARAGSRPLTGCGREGS